MSSQIVTILFLPLQLEFLLFFLIWLLCLGLLILCCFKVVILIYDLRMCFQLFALAYDISCKLITYDLHYVQKCSLNTPLWIFFVSKCWILSKAFSAFEMIYWDDHMIFILHFANMCITLIDMWILNYTCVPGLNPSGLWCMILLMYC